jgi:integrase
MAAARAFGPADISEVEAARFRARVVIADNGCHEYPWRLTSTGYAKVILTGRREVYAHRLAYVLHHGDDLDPSLTIDHLCRNRMCVNPEHLEQVSIGVNVKRGEHPRGRTPKKHTNPKTGEHYYRVRYRRAGKQRALTFYGAHGLKDATEFTALLDTLGADRAVAWWNANLERDDTGPTLDEWWPRYLAATTGLTDGTRLTYERTYRRVWSPAIGSRPLAAITREDIAHVINDLSARKADKTVRNAYGIIASCFKVAVSDNVIPTTPCLKIRLPRRTEHTAAEMRFLTYDEWAVLYNALPAHYRPLFTTLIGTGIRWGEAEALAVADVVPSDHGWMLRVNKAAKWNASKATRDIGPTKTRKSNRTVTLPPEVVEVVAPLIAGRRGSERLFLAPRGGELRHRTVYDEWKAACGRADLDPQPRIHDLRHTHVAWLIAAGIPLPVIQARLGHESIKTTVDRYGHLLPDLQVAAAQAASVAMRPREPLVLSPADTASTPG